jgi:hypothetical protein
LSWLHWHCLVMEWIVLEGGSNPISPFFFVYIVKLTFRKVFLAVRLWNCKFIYCKITYLSWVLTVSEIIGSCQEVSKNTSLIWKISFNGQRCDLQIHHCFLNDRSIACSWYIKNRKKATFAIVLFPIQNIPDEGHYLSRKQVGSALTKTKNWDLLVDCTSRDGRKMLDAGVHLSDAHTVSNIVQNILPNPLLL